MHQRSVPSILCISVLYLNFVYQSCPLDQYTFHSVCQIPMCIVLQYKQLCRLAIHPSPKVIADFFRYKNQHDALIEFAQFLVDLCMLVVTSSENILTFGINPLCNVV